LAQVAQVFQVHLHQAQEQQEHKADRPLFLEPVVLHRLLQQQAEAAEDNTQQRQEQLGALGALGAAQALVKAERLLEGLETRLL
jgi:hypothetical protein